MRRWGSPAVAKAAWPVGAFAVYLLVAVVAFWHVWTGHPTTTTIGGGDSYMDSWFLAYIAEAVVHAHNPFFTAYGNYPYGVNVLANSSQPLLGLLGTPITLAFGAVTTFNVMVTLGMAASATSAYVLVRRFCSWQPAAFLGGLLYGFCQYMVTQSADGHLNISFVALPPLIFLVLHDALVVRRERWVRNGVLLAVLLVAQFFISEEVLVTSVTVAAVMVVAVAIVGRRTVQRAFRPAAKALGLGAGVAAALLAYPAWYTVAGPADIVGPIQPVAQAYRADLAGAVLPDSLERLAPGGHLLSVAEHFATTPAENGSYLGIPLLVIVLAGVVWLWRNRTVLVVAVTGAAAFVLSLGGALALYKAPGVNVAGGAVGRIPLPEALLAKIGPYRNVIPAWFALYVTLAAAVVLAIVLEQLVRRVSLRAGGVAGAAAGVVVGVVALVPLLPTIPFDAAVPIGIPAYFTAGVPADVPGGSVALVFPYPSGLVPAAEAWDAYADLPFKTPGGYFLVPEATGRIADAGVAGYTRTTVLATWMTGLFKGDPHPETPAWHAVLRAALASLHVRTVIAVPQASADPARSEAELEWLLGRPTARRGGTVDWYDLS